MQTTQLKSSLAGSAVRPTQRVARQQRISRTVAAVSADPIHLEIRSARLHMRTRLPAVSVPSAGLSYCVTAHDGLGLGAAAHNQAIRLVACCLEGASWEMWAASGKLQPISKRSLCGMQVQDGRRGPSQGAMGLFGALAAIQIALLPVSGGSQLAALAGVADYEKGLLNE